jgi:hypothetical protein
MTHACCPGCRIRVTSASPVGAPPCPGCSHPMVRTAAAESIGYMLVPGQPLPSAAAVTEQAALRVPPDARS